MAVGEHENWSPAKITDQKNGARVGWWNMSENGEAFMDQAVTWRELGSNGTRLWSDYDAFDSLPVWARKTMDEHAGDPREHIYSLAEFETAATPTRCGTLHKRSWCAKQ